MLFYDKSFKNYIRKTTASGDDTLTTPIFDVSDRIFARVE